MIFTISMKNKDIHILMFFLFFITTCNVQAQQVIKNRIIDSKTGEGVPFVNVALKSNPVIGTSSRDDGVFELKVKHLNDTLLISSIGYQAASFPLKTVIKADNLPLNPVAMDLQEVVIKAGINKAWSMLKKIHHNRKKNNPENLKNYSYKRYSKNTITFENINLAKKGSRFYKNVKDALIKKNDSLYSLPIMINEDVTQCYIDNNGLLKSKPISEKNNGISFFESSSIKEITGEMVESTNFYHNYIALLSKYVPSPIGKHSRLYYKMYISDSIIQNGNQYMKINFFPRNTQDLALNGYFWIDTVNWAITEVYGRLLQRTNINFVRDFVMHNEYQQMDDKKWYYKRKETDVIFDYNIIGTDDDKKENVTVRVKKVRFFSDLATHLSEKDNPIKEKTFAPLSQNIERPEALDKHEQLIDNKINLLKKKPFVVFMDKSINMLMNGYYEQGKIDIGPVTDFYAHNLVEGYRVNLGIRTNQNLSPYNSIGGFVGYGSKDEEWKYGITYLHRFKNIAYNKLKIDFWKDVMPVGSNDNFSLIRENAYSKTQDNIFISLFSISPIRNLNLRKHLSVSFEHDIKKGVTQVFKLQGNRLYANNFISFGDYDYLDFGEASYTIRFSFNEHYFDEYFHRIYHGNKSPVIHLKFSAGKYILNDKSDLYGKLHFVIKHRLNLGLGVFKYLIESGMILGNVPFPLLEISRGNQTYGMSRHSFNTLNYMEYANDKYASIHGNFLMNGILLNRIPLIKKLQLREVFSIKALWGSLSNKHKNIIPVPQKLTEPSNPHVEVGVGISNLFKAIHIEYVWRLTDRNKPDTPTSGIRARLEFSL